MVSTFTQPDFTSQSATAYKTAIDDSVSVLARNGSAFGAHEQTTPDMTVRIDAGYIYDGSTITEVAAQNTGTITAPSTNPRIDRITINSSGTVVVTTGSEAASPSPPALPTGNIPVAQVSLTTSTTEITNADITDERVSLLGLNNVITTGSHTIPVPAAAIQPSTTNGCAVLATLEGATNDVDISYLAFDTSTQEYAYFAFRAPKSVDEATGIYVTPSWMHPSTATNFGVVWGIQILARGNSDALDASWGTEQTSTDTGGTTDDIFIAPETSAITPGGTWAEGDWLIFRIYRKVADASDNLAVDARLIGVDVRITYDAGNDD